MEQLTDIALISKVKEGDSSAFHCLFQKYYQPLYLFSRKFVDDETAKDFVQDCFLELWRNRNRVEITSSFSGWIFMVLKNKCFKHLKEEIKKNNGNLNIYRQLKEEELIFFTYSEKSIFEFDLKDRIRKVLAYLPDKCNLIFNESRINGLSNKEIAEKYDISVKSVEKHISKALKLFKDEFHDCITLVLYLFALQII